MKTRTVAASVAFWALLSLIPLSALSSEPVFMGLNEEKAALEMVAAQTGLTCTPGDTIVQCNSSETVGPQGPIFPGYFCTGYRGTACGHYGMKAYLYIDSYFSEQGSGVYRLSEMQITTTHAASRAGVIIHGLDRSAETAFEALLASSTISSRGAYSCRPAGSEEPRCITSLLAGGGCREEFRAACHLPGSDVLLKPDAMIHFHYWASSTTRGRQRGDFGLDSVTFEF